MAALSFRVHSATTFGRISWTQSQSHHHRDPRTDLHVEHEGVEWFLDMRFLLILVLQHNWETSSQWELLTLWSPGSSLTWKHHFLSEKWRTLLWDSIPVVKPAWPTKAMKDWGGVTWLMRERPPIPGGGDSGGDPNPLAVNRPEAENRDIALQVEASQSGKWELAIFNILI